MRRMFIWMMLAFMPLFAQNLPENATENAAEIVLDAVSGDAKVTLNWLAREAGETERYFVERSVDGHVFTIVSEFQARKNIRETHRHEFVDGMVINGERYFYRITLLDADQQLSHSETVEALPQTVLSESLRR